MKLTTEAIIEGEALAKDVGRLSMQHRKDSRYFLQDFLAGLDVDSYCYIRDWIRDNPLDDAVQCPSCQRMTQKSKLTMDTCTYCRRALP